MDTLAGYITSMCVGAIGTYLSQFLTPRVKIRYWQPHSFIYTIPNNQFSAPNPTQALPAPAGNVPVPAPAPANYFLLTQSITIQNFGRKSADWVEIVLAQKPDYFQLYPALNFTQNTNATGEHTLHIESLAAKEFFTIQFLCYTHAPALSLVRSNAGRASEMPWMTVKKLPRWVYLMMWLAMVIGAGFAAYWIIRGGTFIYKSLGA